MTGSIFRLITGVTAAMLPTVAMAQENQGYFAEPGQIGLPPAATPIMESIVAFHDGLLIWVISAITLFVLALMLFVMIRFHRRANPTPHQFSHNTLVEVIWVVVPIVILMVIAAPSFAVLADQMTTPDGERKYLGSNIFSWGEVEVPAPELTIKTTGYQWYWGFEYVDQGATLESIMLPETARQEQKPNQPRLLAVDNELVVPVNTTVRLQVTAADVIHAFAMPAFGIKTDAVPGRLNETWFNARKTGVFYGQCSELCGKDHAYMPIAIRVVTEQEFATWMEALQAGNIDDANMTLAAIE